MAADGAAVTGREEEEERRHVIHGALFLSAVAAAGMTAGFGSALAQAKKKSPHWFSKGALPAVSGPESGAGLALRALGWGSLWAWSGVGLLGLLTWKLMGVHSLAEFRMKMGSVFPSIPKSAQDSAGPEPDWDSLFKSK